MTDIKGAKEYKSRVYTDRPAYRSMTDEELAAFLLAQTVWPTGTEYLEYWSGLLKLPYKEADHELQT